MEKFCKHVVKIENEYIKRDGIVEDTLEEMTIELGDDDSDDDDDDDDLMDEDDRRTIDRALQSTTNTQTNDPCTNPRRDLSHLFSQFSEDFLESVLPLP